MISLCMDLLLAHKICACLWMASDKRLARSVKDAVLASRFWSEIQGKTGSVFEQGLKFLKNNSSLVSGWSLWVRTKYWDPPFRFLQSQTKPVPSPYWVTLWKTKHHSQDGRSSRLWNRCSIWQSLYIKAIWMWLSNSTGSHLSRFWVTTVTDELTQYWHFVLSFLHVWKVVVWLEHYQFSGRQEDEARTWC